MVKERQPTQEQINGIWSAEWKNQEASPAVFRQRLFLEGYPVFKSYMPAGVERILDVGGGTGRYGIMFAKDFPASEVTATDVLDESLDLGRKLAEIVGVSNVRFEREDVLQLSYSPDSFDVVFCDVVIMYLPTYMDAVREMIRVLKPGGILIISVNNKWNLPHTGYKLMRLFFGNTYEYGYERSFSPIEMRALLRGTPCELVALDGFYAAYGVYRWRKYWQGFRWIAGALNRMSRLLDRVSNRAFSRMFGMEVFIAARKIGAA